MALIRVGYKLKQLFKSANVNLHALSGFVRDSPRHYSTENQQSSVPIDSFLHPSSGVVYGKLMGINENTLKTDVISLLEGCSLTLDDIKVHYDRKFYPMAMLVQFPSMSEYTAAFRDITRKGRLYRLEKAVHQDWNLLTPFNGSYVLLQGIPRNALMDDVERFLSGCNYDAASLEMFTRGVGADVIRLAKVRFPSQIEAMNAVIQKNGTFCLNNRIVTRIIQ